MKKKIVFMICITGFFCFAMAGWVMASPGTADKYYVGKVVGLNAVDNTLTITDYNSEASKEFKCSQTGLPGDIMIGDEVVGIADKKNDVRNIRLLQSNIPRPLSGPRRTLRGTRPAAARNARFQEWDPFAEISRLQEQMNTMFQDSLQTGNMGQGLFKSNLSYDKDFKLEDTGDKYILRLDLTGLDKDNVEIKMDKDSITLKGQSETESREDNSNGTVQYHSFGSFLKTIPLPPDADTKNMDSKLEGDSMVITIPKK